MARGRKSLIYKQGRISEKKVTELALDMIIDPDGNRLSIRDLFSNDYFMDMSGFWRRDSYGNRIPLSFGTMSYNIEKLNITEKDIYDYHKNVTGRIAEDIDFETFSMKKNKGGRVYGKKLKIDEIDNKYLCYALIDFFKDNNFEYPIYPHNSKEYLFGALNGYLTARCGRSKEAIRTVEDDIVRRVEREMKING